MILTVTLNPCIDKTVFIKKLRLGEIIRADGVKKIAGGKGVNVARVVRNLGESVLALVIVGGRTGAEIMDLIGREGIPARGVRIADASRTVTTVLDTGVHVQTAYVEPGHQVTPQEAERFKNVFARLLVAARPNLVVFSGSSPCQGLDGLFAGLIELAKRRGLRTLLDSRGEALALGLRALPTVIKPNVAEAEYTLKRTLTSEPEMMEAARDYVRMGIELVVLSRGRRGAIVACGDRIWRTRPPQVEEVNPVGSGDSMVAGLAVGLVRGYPTEDVIRLGMAAGAANAAMWDAASCRREDVESLLPGVEIELIE